MNSKIGNLAWAATLTALLTSIVLVGYGLVYKQVADHRFPAYSQNGHVYLSDFISFYNPGRMIMKGDRYNIYNPYVQRDWTNRLIAPLGIGKVFFHQGVPFLFPLMIPLGLLPVGAAYLLWCALGVAFGGGALWMFLRRHTGWDWRRSLVFCLLCLLSMPSVFGLHLGQSEWFMLGFVVLLFSGILSSDGKLFGMALAFTTLKPQFSLILAAPALGLKRGRTVAFAIICELLLLALAVVAIGWHNVANYPSVLQEAEQTSAYAGVAPQAMTCLRLLLTSAFGQAGGLTASYALMLLAMLVLVGAWWCALGAALSQWRWLGALTVIAALIFSPHAHPYDLLLLAAAAALTADEPSWNPHLQRSLARRLWFFLLYGYPLWGYLLLNAAGESRLPLLLCNLVLLAAGSWVYAGSAFRLPCADK